MSAPELTAEEREIVDRFGIFAEEELREKVAVAIMDADYEQATGGLMEWSDFDGNEQRHYRALAVAAITALRGPAADDETGAVERVREVVTFVDECADSSSPHRAGVYRDIGRRLRAALAGDQP